MKRAFVLLLLVLASFPGSAGLAHASAGRKPTRKAAPILSEQAAQASGVSTQEVRAATQLYTTKCMRCHKSYEPNTYEQAEWDLWMNKMKRKAHLTAEQENLLLKYLGAYRENSPGGTNGGDAGSRPKLAARQER